MPSAIIASVLEYRNYLNEGKLHDDEQLVVCTSFFPLHTYVYYSSVCCLFPDHHCVIESQRERWTIHEQQHNERDDKCCEEHLHPERVTYHRYPQHLPTPLIKMKEELRETIKPHPNIRQHFHLDVSPHLQFAPRYTLWQPFLHAWAFNSQQAPPGLFSTNSHESIWYQIGKRK